MAVGIIFAGLQVPHLVADINEQMGIPALVTGAVGPFMLAVSMSAAGCWVWRSDIPTDYLRRVNMWFLLGLGGMTLVSGALVVYELLEGAQLSHTLFLLLDFATAGGIAGILVGWYDAVNQHQQAQLRVFREVTENGGHCIYVTGPDGTIEYVNPQFEAQTGYDQEEAIGRNPRILKSGEHDEAVYEELWTTILSGETWQNELVNERKDGTQYWVDQTISPITDGQGDIDHFVAINRDITEKKRYESELERQNERLDEFASVISHDLRNPLNVALARIDLARQETESEHLDTAKRSLDRMEQMIGDVLALAREGRTIDETDPVSLRAVSGDAWNQIESATAAVSIRTDLSVIADRSRLQQLLENLFRNAIEHGGEEVTIRVGECDEGFYIEDTGSGFSADEQEHLFETGYTTADNGTGFGLAIVQRIVEAHGWEITATNGTDGGARFEITGVATATDSHAIEV
ncbi:MAG: PAS domain S-box protein [Halorientalis sp.]